MNIDKEREAFEAIFGKNGCEYYPEYNAYQNGNDRNEDAINGKWYAWQAAKAQAVPESNALLSDAMDAVQKLGSGDFVLVPKEPTCEMIEAGMGNFDFPLDNGRFSNHDLIFAYRAMIEAQEQSHD